jgi:hypothetical protein
MTIINNKKGLSAVVHLTSNATITVTGNSSVSNVAIGDETVIGAYISQIWYGSANGATGYWEIKRGANTVGVFSGTGYMDFAGNGIALNNDSSATLVANLNSAAAGFIVIELTKSPTNSAYA